MKRQPFATIHGLRVGEASPARATMPGDGSASREARSASVIGLAEKPAASQASTCSGGTQSRLMAAASSFARLSAPSGQYTQGRLNWGRKEGRTKGDSERRKEMTGRARDVIPSRPGLGSSPDRTH